MDEKPENQENQEHQEENGGSEGQEEQHQSEEASAPEESAAPAPEPEAPAPASEPAASIDPQDDLADRATVKSVSMKWGLYMGLAYIIWNLVMSMTELDTNRALQWASSIIFIIGVVMAHNEFKRDGDGFMSYKQGLGIGTLSALISAVIGNVFS